MCEDATRHVRVLHEVRHSYILGAQASWFETARPTGLVPFGKTAFE